MRFQYSCSQLGLPQGRQPRRKRLKQKRYPNGEGVSEEVAAYEYVFETLRGPQDRQGRAYEGAGRVSPWAWS